MAPERTQAIIEDLLSRQNQATTEEGYRQLMYEAGLIHVANIVSFMDNILRTSQPCR